VGQSALSDALRKTIIRTVVKEVIVNEDAATERLQCIIHWQGGSHTSFEMPKPQWGIADKTAPDTIELIRQMAVRYSDEEIARVLNKHGRRTGKGNRWTTNREGAARRRCPRSSTSTLSRMCSRSMAIAPAPRSYGLRHPCSRA